MSPPKPVAPPHEGHLLEPAPSAPLPARPKAPPLRERLADAIEALKEWPWFETLRTLRLRFREDRLGLTASSLTFTTLIALVPLVTLMLAIFTAFPIFSRFQGALEKYFLQSLVPDTIARPVLVSLTRFASKAHELGVVGLIALLATALALMLTIDRTLNAIWRVRKPRPIAQRVLVYWAAMTLGPLILGVSLTLTSYAASVSRGWVGAMPGGISFALDVFEFLLLAFAMAGLFHYVPNTHVRWRHALAGGIFVSGAIELAKRGLALYVTSVPVYTNVYGAFATVPILLLWVYVGWVIVLLGAVIAAYAPSLQMHVVRRAETPGHRFALAIAALRELAEARAHGRGGLSLGDLAERLRIDPLQLEPVIELVESFDWVGRLEEEGGQRHVLLCDPANTPAALLVDRLLLEPAPVVEAFRRRAGLQALQLSELIEAGPAGVRAPGR